MPPLATPAHGRGAEEEPRPDRPGCAAWCQEWICDYEECSRCGSEVGCGPLESKDLPDAGARDEQSTGVVGWHSPPPSPPCSYSGNNCISTGCCHDPAHFACMKARNKPMTAQCRTIPGEGCEDTDDWICPGWKLSDAEWAAMTGKEPALRRSPPPPMPPHLTCAVGDGSCFESRCCADARAGCYRKRHKYFAQCLPRVANCADNAEWLCPSSWIEEEKDVVVEVPDARSPPTPAAPPAPPRQPELSPPTPPPPPCAPSGGECHASRCCRGSAFSCFARDDDFAKCMRTCDPATNPSLDGWLCAKLQRSTVAGGAGDVTLYRPTSGSVGCVELGRRIGTRHDCSFYRERVDCDAHFSRLESRGGETYLPCVWVAHQGACGEGDAVYGCGAVEHGEIVVGSTWKRVTQNLNSESIAVIVTCVMLVVGAIGAAYCKWRNRTGRRIPQYADAVYGGRAVRDVAARAAAAGGRAAATARRKMSGRRPRAVEFETFEDDAQYDDDDDDDDVPEPDLPELDFTPVPKRTVAPREDDEFEEAD